MLHSPTLDDLIERFSDLITLNGVSGKERPVADYVRKTLAEYSRVSLREDTMRHAGDHNAGNLILTVGDGGDTVFLAHMDTARPTEGVNPQFEIDRITSDGTTILGVDNRAGMAILLQLITMAERHPEKYGDFTVAFTVCEETDMSGSKSLTLPENITMGFAFDSSHRPGHFIRGSYGAKRFEATIHGIAAHSGLEPEKGINAIQVAGHALSQLRIGRINENTTVNVATISGGSAINVVPEKTVITGEIRSESEQSVDTMLEEISETFTVQADEFSTEVEITSSWDFAPYFIDDGAEEYKRVSAAIRECALTPVPHLSPGGSDANSLNASGIPAVNIGIGAQNPHSNEEFILLEDLEKGLEIACALAATT